MSNVIDTFYPTLVKMRYYINYKNTLTIFILFNEGYIDTTTTTTTNTEIVG